MKTLKGPAIFLAQFMSDEEPFSSLSKIAAWASKLGFVGIQLPTNNPDFIDVKKAAESKVYCDELKGHCSEFGIEITELSTHLEGQLIAVHPACVTGYLTVLLLRRFTIIQKHGQIGPRNS